MQHYDNPAIQTIADTNETLWNYFNQLYVSNSEELQNLKTELFELTIQIETLQKTTELYHSPSEENRHNAFSPGFVPDNDTISHKKQQILSEIEDCKATKTQYQTQINTLEKEVEFYKTQLTNLQEADKQLQLLAGKVAEYDKQKDCTYFLTEHIKPKLSSSIHKVNFAKKILPFDPNRVKLTLDELNSSLLTISDSIDEQLL